MRFFTAMAGLVLWIALIGSARAQEAWVQIEARPNVVSAEERAAAWSESFPNVAGFALSTGWYAITLGPYGPDEAAAELRRLRQGGLIPSDSYIAIGNVYGARFWPKAGIQLPVARLPGAATSPPSDPATDPAQEPAAEPAVVLPETLGDARRAEAVLSDQERRRLQEALRWQGHYAGTLDGHIGPGTRRAMEAWQAAGGQEVTGVLTTRQRTALLAAYQSDIDAIGLRTLREDEAGIALDYPANLVAFDRYAPPFADYKPANGSGYRMLLISAPGDPAALAGLYAMMQTLAIVPEGGERFLEDGHFVLSGKSEALQSQTEVFLKDGMIKGYTLAWPPGDGRRALRILGAMEASFAPFGNHALETGAATPLAVDRKDLISGLDERRPTLTRSGFWLDRTGLVATTGEAIAGCGRLTLGAEEIAADVVLDDAASGLAVLRPRQPLVPLAAAELAPGGPRVSADIAVAGFPYGSKLDGAVLSFGALAEKSGLEGEPDRARLSVVIRAGDAGAPVLDSEGRVVAMVLPSGAAPDRVLPEDVAIALPAAAIAAALAKGKVTLAPSAAAAAHGALAPEDLVKAGRDLALRVDCWP